MGGFGLLGSVGKGYGERRQGDSGKGVKENSFQFISYDCYFEVKKD